MAPSTTSIPVFFFLLISIHPREKKHSQYWNTLKTITQMSRSLQQEVDVFFLVANHKKTLHFYCWLVPVDSNRKHIKPYSFPGRCMEIKQKNFFYYFPHRKQSSLPPGEWNRCNSLLEFNVFFSLTIVKVYWNPFEDVKGLWKTLKTPNQTCRK